MEACVTEKLVLRKYQVESVDRLRDGYRAGHRSQLLVAPCGAGKTAMATHLMMQARDRQTRTAFVVDRVNLVDQTSAALDRYSVPHGVVQAGHWRRTGWEPIQICSAQTLEKRGFFPDLKLLIVDEAHCMRKQTIDLIRNRTDLRVLGLTATPFAEGMDKIYSNVVNVTTTDALIAEGHLVPLKIYAAVKPDMAGAKVVAGEWSDKEITQRGRVIIGDIVAEWTDKTALHFGDFCAGGLPDRAADFRQLVVLWWRVQRCAGQCRGRAGDCLSLCAGSGHADGDHGWCRAGGALRHPRQKCRGAGTC